MAALPPKPIVLACGRHLFPYGHAEAVGPRPTMEDAVACVGDFAGSGSCYYGVFDGHNGSEVAKYACNNIHRQFNQEYSSDYNIQGILKDSIAEVNEFMLKKWPDQGTTVSVALVIKDYIYTANVGDSRIVLITPDGTVKQLSEDHRCCDAKESDIVRARGGFELSKKNVAPLQLSRSLGDGLLGNKISSEPYMTRTHRKDGMGLIIASDGLWDVMDNETAARIVASHSGSANAAANALKEAALKRGTTDNVAVIVVFLTAK